jgi:all-trans-nonaprenyl-diphosphate synthase
MSQTITKSLQDILSPVLEEIQALDRRLIDDISPSSRALCGILQEIFKAGGKRLRPALSFLVTKALGKEINEDIYLIAEISELIHTASLVHDDIIDNSLVRRGQATTNSKWNNAITVISGDFMFARAAVNLGKLGKNDITTLFAKVLEDLCDGEIRQVEKKFSTDIDWDYYYAKSYKKTASLFEACTKAPAIALGFSAEEIQACADYGKYLGLAFQVIDDILDYSSDTATLGKPSCADLREGQITIPLLFTLEKLSKEDSGAYLDLVEKIERLSAEPDNNELSQEIFALVRKSGSIEKSRARAEELIQQAIGAITNLNDSVCKIALYDLAIFTLTREK